MDADGTATTERKEGEAGRKQGTAEARVLVNSAFSRFNDLQGRVSRT